MVGSDGERVARYATRHGIGRGTTSVEEALGSGVDAVYVSTTNERHAAGVHAAVGAGATCSARSRSPPRSTRPGRWWTRRRAPGS